jgi:hypothetical protein
MKKLGRGGGSAGATASFDGRAAANTPNDPIQSYFWQPEKKGGKLHPDLVKPPQASDSSAGSDWPPCPQNSWNGFSLPLPPHAEGPQLLASRRAVIFADHSLAKSVPVGHE